MSEELQALIEQARSLSADERELLMLQLHVMQDAEPVDPTWEAEWAAECEHRLKELDEGKVRATPWEEVRARLWAKYPTP